MAQVLKSLGTRASCVPHGHGGLDELTTSGPNQISSFGLPGDNGELNTTILDPQSLGFERADAQAFDGGTPEDNAVITQEILTGEDRGQRRDIVLLNSAMALYVGGEATSLEQGVVLASESIDRGYAQETLAALVQLSQALAVS